MEMQDLAKIPTVAKLKQMSQDYYDSFQSARERGIPVAYVTAVYPVEILRAMDILPYYPENYAVICAVRKMTEELSDAAEAKGYARDLCAYARAGLGSVFYEKSNPLGGMPVPDFLFPCNTQCNTLTKWFEVTRKIFNIPLLLLDAPFVRGTSPYQHSLDYFVAQLKELVVFLQLKTGRRLDIDRLREVLRYSAEGCKLWNEVLDFAQYKPAPWTAFDAYIHMAAIVTHRGTKACVEYYRELKSFLEKRVSENYACVPTEKYRFYWDNIPLWFRLRGQYDLLASYGIVLLASLYIHSWAYNFDTQDPFRSLAENYLSVFCNTDIENRTSLILGLINRYRLNGYIFLSNRSCKAASFGAYDIIHRLIQKTGKPGLVLEADMGDPRFFSQDEFKVKLEAYLEVLDSNPL